MVQSAQQGSQEAAVGGSGGTCPVGGTPTNIDDGSSALRTAAGALHSAIGAVASNCRAGGSASGDPDIAAALTRFEAALTQYLDDLSTQVEAASTLAFNGARDLTVAGGGH
jgi:hypothetical protein